MFTSENQPEGRGRNPGIQNRTTTQAKEMILDVLEGNSDRFKKSLEKLRPRDFCDMYLRLLKMVLPKEINARMDYNSLSDEQLDHIIETIIESNHESNIAKSED